MYRLKKHGVRASIISSSTSVAKENIATCLDRDFLFSSGNSYHSKDAFEREGFSSRIVWLYRLWI